MDNPEIRQFKEIDSERFNELLDGDYPNDCTNFVWTWLGGCASGGFTEELFRSKAKGDKIMDVDQYVKEKLEPNFGLTIGQLSPDVQKRVDVINGLVVEMRAVLDQQKPLKEIYQVLLKFRDKAGIHVEAIPGLE